MADKEKKGKEKKSQRISGKAFNTIRRITDELSTLKEKNKDWTMSLFGLGKKQDEFFNSLDEYYPDQVDIPNGIVTDYGVPGAKPQARIDKAIQRESARRSLEIQKKSNELTAFMKKLAHKLSIVLRTTILPIHIDQSTGNLKPPKPEDFEDIEIDIDEDDAVTEKFAQEREAEAKEKAEAEAKELEDKKKILDLERAPEEEETKE